MTQGLKTALILFSVFLFPALLVGQKTPGEIADEKYGFREYKFDMHVSEFSDLKEIKNNSDTKNVKTYIPINANLVIFGDSLESIELSFYKDRLYKVHLYNNNKFGSDIYRDFMKAFGVEDDSVIRGSGYHDKWVWIYGDFVSVNLRNDFRWKEDYRWWHNNFVFTKKGLKGMIRKDAKREALDDF